jgi:hypothetical protein
MPEGHDPVAARDALDAFEGDRSGIGSRMTAETWWGAPAQGFATALLIAGPAAGIQWAWLPFLAAALIFFGVSTGWILLLALVTGVLTTLIVAAYDRTYAVEVQRAR